MRKKKKYDDYGQLRKAMWGKKKDFRSPRQTNFFFCL